MMKCAECENGTLLLRDSRFGKFYGCSNFPRCQGSIGAHQRPPFLPLGTPADPETKRLRIAVHERLDPLWRGGPRGERSRIYAELSAFLGKTYHTGECNADECRRVLAWLETRSPSCNGVTHPSPPPRHS